jgi:hypothetical protein
LRKNWHGQDYGQQQSEDGAVFHFNFLQEVWGAENPLQTPLGAYF